MFKTVDGELKVFNKTILSTQNNLKNLQTQTANLSYYTSSGNHVNLQNVPIAQPQTVSNFTKLNNAFNVYNSNLTKSTGLQNAYIKSVGTQNQALGNYLAGLKGAPASFGGYIAALTKAKLATIGLHAASIALNMALTMGVVVIINTITKAFAHLYNIQDKIAEKTKELTDSLKSQTDEYKNLKSDLDEVNKKLKDNESRYSELIEKQKESGLTTEESGELEELQRITGELTNQKNILEENIRLKKESAASTAQELASTLLKQEDVKSFMDGAGGKIKSFFNEIQESSIKMIPGFGKLYSAIDTVISLFNVEIPKDSWLNKIANIFDGTAIISWLTGTDIEEDSYDEAVSKYEDLQKKMKAIRDKYDKNGDGIIDSDASMSSEDSETYKKYYDESVEVANNLKTEYQELDDAIKAIEADPNLTQVNKEELERLRAARDIIAEILGYNNEGKTGDGIISDEDVKNVDKMTDSLDSLSSAINAAESAFELFNEVEKDFNSTGAISAENIQKILNKFPELEDELYEYIMGMRSGASVMDLLKTKSDDMATMSAEAFRKMYLSSNSTSKDIKDGFATTFKAIGLGWDNTQSVMANVNTQIIDANGTVTSTFATQWATACQQAGISVQTFAEGLSSLFTGGVWDGTSGAYVKDGYAIQHNADGSYYTFANAQTFRIQEDIKNHGKEITDSNGLTTKYYSPYYDQYGGYFNSDGSLKTNKDGSAYLIDGKSLYATVNDTFVNQIEENYADKAEYEARQKEFEEKIKQLAAQGGGSSSSSYSDYWDELLEEKENSIDNIDTEISRANKRLEYALEIGNAEQIKIWQDKLDELRDDKKKLLEDNAAEARTDLATIMESIYAIAPELKGKAINEITPYEIEFVSQSLEGNELLKNEWNSLTKTAQNYYKTITEWSDGWWENESDKLDDLESKYNTILDEIDRHAERIQNHYDDQIKAEEALLEIKQAQFEAQNNIADAQAEIDKEIRNSRNSKQYLSKDEYERIFNEEDYTKLSKGIKRIGNEINSLTDDFYKQVEDAYANGQVYLVEHITAEYERQLAMKERELEIAKANVDLEKKRLTLENTLAEKNIKQYSENGITWVADQEKVKQATEDFVDAQAEIANLQKKATQQRELDSRQANIDMLEMQKDALNDSIDKLKKAIENVTDPLADFSALIQNLIDDIDKSISDTAKSVNSNVSGSRGSSGGSSGGGGGGGFVQIGLPSNYEGATVDVKGVGKVTANIQNGKTQNPGLKPGDVVNTSDGRHWEITGGTAGNYTSKEVDKPLYDNGGIASGKGLMLKDVNEEETVLPPWLTAKVLTPEYNENFSKLLENMQMVSYFNPSDFIVKPQTDSLIMKNNNQPTSITKTWTGNMYVEGGDPNEVLKALDQAFDRITM